MFQIYLPIAEISVNLVVMLGLGAAVGFLSGMFGVGGGFLLTPFLMLSGIPPAIAVATGANQIVASSVSGTMAHWRRGNVDLRMGIVLIAGGVVGAVIGVFLLKILREVGQAGLMISLTYVCFLGVIGALMLWESVNAMLRARAGKAVSARKSGQHNWIHGLPFKMRFPTSRLYISTIPPLVIGFLVGLLASFLGVGGGFIMVPAMIYLLRMPTNIVIGTSIFQIIFITAIVTLLHATFNYTLDLVLAFVLVDRRRDRRTVRRAGGPEAPGRTIARAALPDGAWRRYPHPARSRDPAVRPLQHRANGRVVMRTTVLHLAPLLLALFVTPALAQKKAPAEEEEPASQETVQSDISTRQISIQSNFTGVEILIFGSIDFSDSRTPGEGTYDVISVVRGPNDPIVVRKKERVAGIWVNGPAKTYGDVPGFYAVLSSRPIRAIASDETLKGLGIGLSDLDFGRHMRRRLGRASLPLRHDPSEGEEEPLPRER